MAIVKLFGRRFAVGSCDIGTVDLLQFPPQCFPQDFSADPAERYKWARCVVDGQSWLSWVAGDPRVTACRLWLAAFNVATLVEGIEQGFTGQAGESERIQARALASVEEALADASKRLESDDPAAAAAAAEEIGWLSDWREGLLEPEAALEYFYFGAEGGEVAADALETAKELGRQAVDLVLDTGRKALWWTLGILGGVAVLGGVGYAVVKKAG